MKRTLHKALSMLLTAAMILNMGLTPVFAEGTTPLGISGVCTHHTEHTEDCGYKKGTPCNHAHTEDCSTKELTCALTEGEAPSEMNVYITKERSLCIAENCTSTLHNLYTLRGAQVRDPEKWADYLDQTIALFGNKMENVFSTHNWPHFGNGESIRYMQSQRDCYQYIKDQTLRLMSKGYTID